jgi:hypothetical protein
MRKTIFLLTIYLAAEHIEAMDYLKNHPIYASTDKLSLLEARQNFPTTDRLDADDSSSVSQESTSTKAILLPQNFLSASRRRSNIPHAMPLALRGCKLINGRFELNKTRRPLPSKDSVAPTKLMTLPRLPSVHGNSGNEEVPSIRVQNSHLCDIEQDLTDSRSSFSCIDGIEELK